MSLPPGWRRDWREAGGVRTHALVAGSGQPIVLVPGLSCSHLTFRRLQESLAALGFQVWAYDPPGYGLSPAPAGAYLTMDGLASHLAAWLAAAGLRGPVLLGHSQGAELAIAVSAADPGAATKLVLLAPTGIPEYPNLLVQGANLAGDLPQERVGFLPPLAASYWRAGLRRTLAHWTDQLRHDTTGRLASVRAPTLVLYGTRDRVVRPLLASAFAAAMPHAQVQAIAGAGHGLQDHRAEQVAAATASFLGVGGVGR